MQMGNITYGDLDNELQSFEEDDDLDEGQTINLTEMSGEIDAHASKELLFISLVSKEEFLFNPTHADYRNFSKKDQKWQEIGKRLGGWTESQCKAKWKAFRDQYCREIKKKRLKDKRKIKWKYFKHLGFIRPYALTRKYRERLPIVNIENLIKNTEFVRTIPVINNDNNAIMIETNHITSFAKTPNIEWTYITNTTNQEQKTLNSLEEIPPQVLEQDALYSAIENMKELPESEQQQQIHFKPNNSSSNEEDEDEDPIRTFLNIESYFEKDLIALVHNEYKANPSHNFRLKVNDCEFIAKKLKKSVTQVRCKWKALRDQFIREYKRLNKHKILAPILPKWKHYDAMSFLLNFTKIQQTKCDSPKEQNNADILAIEDKTDTLQDPQQKIEEVKELEINSLHPQYDYCTQAVDEYEIDIDDYMIQDNEDVEEYCNEQEFIEVKTGQQEFSILNATNTNDLQHNVNIVTTTNEEYQSEQQNSLTNLTQQELIDIPTIDINEKSHNLTNNIISNIATTGNDHNSDSYQNSLQHGNIIDAASLDISTAHVILADSTNPEPTSSSSPPITEEIFIQNNNDPNISTTTSLGNNILNHNILPTNEENDEVATFFKLVSMKVRNANLSHVALTELQIGILHLINDSLKKC